MRHTSLLVAALFAVLPVTTHASWYESCDIEGGILEASPASARHTYSLKVVVQSAARAQNGGEASQTDCSRYVGRTINVPLRFPRKVAAPSPGDRVKFHLIAADGVNGDDSYAGTTIKTSFIDFHEFASPPES